MLDFLHSLFETILQAVLAVVLGVFGEGGEGVRARGYVREARGKREDESSEKTM